MLDFLNSLNQMLTGGLIAQSNIAGLQIEEDAAKFFVNRAINNIVIYRQTPETQYQAAIIAIQNLPDFVSLIKSQTERREFLTESSAIDAIDDVTRTTDCVFPWCKDRPREAF